MRYYSHSPNGPNRNTNSLEPTYKTSKKAKIHIRYFSTGSVVFFYAIFLFVSGLHLFTVRWYWNWTNHNNIYLEWSECDFQNDCIDDLFNNLLETDPKLEFPIFENFEDLFSRGLFEHLSFKMKPNQIRNVFEKIFKNSDKLMKLFEKYYPFANPKKVPNLEDIIRWQIRQKLLVDNHIIFNDKVPMHIFKLLNYYN